MPIALTRGTTGSAVRTLQLLLNDAGASPRLGVDGSFGLKTEAAVREFQSRFGLVVDGVAGVQTMAALRQATTPAKPGKAEPDKSAMAGSVPTLTLVKSAAAPPPNVASLLLLDTARRIEEIILHCTATPEGRDFTVSDIRAWHKARGWSDIGYHYIIYRDGRIMVGRPVGQVGAHVAGHNSGTIGVSYVGGVSANGKTAKDTRTAAQRASLLWLVAALKAKHGGIKKVSGHNEYDAGKACPSFDVRKDQLAAAA